MGVGGGEGSCAGIGGARGTKRTIGWRPGIEKQQEQKHTRNYNNIKARVCRRRFEKIGFVLNAITSDRLADVVGSEGLSTQGEGEGGKERE